MQYSYKVLSEYGNMSSPTILFVLNEIMQAEHADGETIFSIGFGPGLSIETALLTYVTNMSEKSNTNEIMPIQRNQLPRRLTNTKLYPSLK
jgi:hypothetical protein